MRLVLNALKDPLPFRRLVAAYLIGLARRRGASRCSARVACRSRSARARADHRRVVRQAFGGRDEGSDRGRRKNPRDQKIDLTEAAMLAFFRERTLSPEDQKQLPRPGSEPGGWRLPSPGSRCCQPEQGRRAGVGVPPRSRIRRRRGACRAGPFAVDADSSGQQHRGADCRRPLTRTPGAEERFAERGDPHAARLRPVCRRRRGRG